MTLTKRILFKAAFCISLPLLGACGKSVNIGSVDSLTHPFATTPPVNSSKVCPSTQTRKWTFTQPDATAQRDVDLLFVVDTSSSLNTRRTQLASNIPAFMAALHPQTNYRIGTLLAHGGASPYSGKLYQAPGSSLVLNSKTQSVLEIQKELTNTLSHVQLDKDEANGEMMMYSLVKSLEPENFEPIQNSGFFRTGAALSVIFVSDENDVCLLAPVEWIYTVSGLCRLCSKLGDNCSSKIL